MEFRIDRVGGIVLAVAMLGACLQTAPAAAQTLFLCENGGRSFAVAGGDGAPGCRELADPEAELNLAPAEPDLAELAQELSSLALRVERLERTLLAPRTRPAPLSPLARPPLDRFDTQGRIRDLGQDLDRRLDELGR